MTLEFEVAPASADDMPLSRRPVGHVSAGDAQANLAARLKASALTRDPEARSALAEVLDANAMARAGLDDVTADIEDIKAEVAAIAIGMPGA